MGVENFLDNLFTQAATDAYIRSKDKIYEYRLLNRDFDPIKSGKCKVTNRRYDKSIDCDVISIQDIDSGETFSRNQFRLDLVECKEKEATG